MYTERTRRRAAPRNRASAGSLLLVAAAATLALAASAVPAEAATFTVTSALDNGDPGTLRRAIVAANAQSDADVINFGLPLAAGPVIAPISDLPAITSPVTIDGYTQPGSKAATINAPATLAIVIDAVNTTRALELLTDGSVVRGLVVKDSSGVAVADGIRVQGDENRIEGSYIGANRYGESLQMWNLTDGVEIMGDRNVVGGAEPAARNVIETDGDGVTLIGDANRVEGNLLGPDLDPGSNLGNHGHGLRIEGDGNVVGGADAAARNVIADNNLDGINVEGAENRVEGNYVGPNNTGTSGEGNLGNGVTIRGDDNVVGAGNVIFDNDAGVALVGGSSGNRIEGSMIGADATGTAAPGNDVGVLIEDSSRNTVGGADPGAGNVISGNRYDGVEILEGGRNVVVGNAIGTDAGGTEELGNGNSGVHIDWAWGNSVGTPTAGASMNTIAFNEHDGVTVEGGDHNTIVRNSIYENGDLGIDHFDDGVTPNDGAPDDDGGPNDRQNFPEITGAVTWASFDDSEIPAPTFNTSVEWTLDSLPSTDFRVEFYTSPKCDDSGHGEGRTYLGAANAETDADGHAEGSTTTENPAFLDANVVATATVLNPIIDLEPAARTRSIEVQPFLATSEFSPCAGA